MFNDGRGQAGRIVLDFLRDWPLHIVTMVLVGLVLLIAPHQVGILVYKACLQLIAAIGAYWINRLLFARKIRENDVHAQWQATAMICAAMIAVGIAA